MCPFWTSSPLCACCDFVGQGGSKQLTGYTVTSWKFSNDSMVSCVCGNLGEQDREHFWKRVHHPQVEQRPSLARFQQLLEISICFSLFVHLYAWREQRLEWIEVGCWKGTDWFCCQSGWCRLVLESELRAKERGGKWKKERLEKQDDNRKMEYL